MSFDNLSNYYMYLKQKGVDYASIVINNTALLGKSCIKS